MRISTILIAAFAMTILFSSCDKEDDACTAGTGGNFTLVAFGKHHGKLVEPTSVHIKFNTQEYPGAEPADYDLNITADLSEDHIHIENLKCGNYYIYMIGYDDEVLEIVKGGIPYNIGSDKSGEINVDIPITE